MNLTGGQIVIKYLEKEKTPYVIGIPGHGILGLFDAIKESEQDGKIKYIQVKHEQAAIHMADGYFRIKGEPLAVFSSTGPGSLNTTMGLAAAYVDSSAVLQICGDTHVYMRGTGVLQEIERDQDSNFLKAFEPLVKRAWRVDSVCQLPKIMKRSFNYMLSGRQGPVAIALPMNVQSDTADVQIPDPDRTRSANNLCASDGDIQKAVDIMLKAKRPVILAGGAMLRSNAQESLLELAESWGAAVITTMAGKSAFPEDHPLYGFHTGSKGTPVGLELSSKADVILALGVRFADETTSSYLSGKSFSFPETKLIHVDIDPGEIGKNYGCDVGIIADLETVLPQLNQKLKEVAIDRAEVKRIYGEEIRRLKTDWYETIRSKRVKKYEKITISQLIGQLNKHLPEDTIIATSSGNTQAQIFQEYCFKKAKTHLTTGGFSAMGWCLPAAMGAKLARPQAPVVAIMGDGDFMMTMQELSTLAQYDIPVVVVVVNNCGWMAIKDLQADVFGVENTFGNDWIRKGEIYTPDFAGIAKSFGIKGIKISQESEVENAVLTALECNAPVLIEVDVYREYPESGGKAYGWWDVPIPGYYTEKRRDYEQHLKSEMLL